jgi:hypothetical protein
MTKLKVIMVNYILNLDFWSGLNDRTFSICHKEQKCQRPYYTFNSINEFMTSRYTYKTLGVIVPFKRVFISLNFISLLEKYFDFFVFDRRLI